MEILIQGGVLAKIVTSKVAEEQMLDPGEEAYFQRAIKKIAEGEKPNVAFLMTRKNGKRDESHIPYRDPWIYDKFCEQLDSGKEFSEAANTIHQIMVEFNNRAQSKLAEAEATGVVQFIEEAERLLRVSMPIGPERIRDIFEKYDIKFRRVLRSRHL